MVMSKRTDEEEEVLRSEVDGKKIKKSLWEEKVVERCKKRS